MTYLYHSRIIRIITILTGTYLAYYLWWRFNWTLNPNALVFSILLLVAEVQGAINFYLFAFMTWDLKQKQAPLPLPGLMVDIYVPTYNEDLDVLEATLTGCVMMNYPHATYVLDDGRRPEVEELALSLGCRYLTRSDNKHAKAGNINAALAQTDGEFIAVFDADMVPQPDFLDKTLGYFCDEKVAAVQLPQEFYNMDSVQHEAVKHEKESWHEQALFYRVIQPGKNNRNAAFWCGSPSILRRAALESIGGVATETITEDFHTSIRLNARGWKIEYHNEVLAYGIAPQTLNAYLVQRLRWAQGAMQIFRSRENPLIIPGLTPAQRLSHLAAIFTYFDAYQKLIYFFAPVIFLLTGIMPLRVEGWDFLMHWFPYFFLGYLANTALGRGYFRYMQIEKYNMLKMFTFIKASTTFLRPQKLKFQVTPKHVDRSVYAQERINLRPHIIIFSLVAITIILGVLNLFYGLTTNYTRWDVFLIVIFWASANSGILAIGLYEVLHRVYYRKNYRFPVLLMAAVTDVNGTPIIGTTTDLSREGVGLITSSNSEPGSRVSVKLDLPDGMLTVQGTVLYKRVSPDSQRRMGIKFDTLSKADRQRLASFLFITIPRYRQNHKMFPSLGSGYKSSLSNTI